MVKRKKKVKLKCELCPRDCGKNEDLGLNSVEFENYHTLNGKIFCSRCYDRILRQMNGTWKKKLPGYGKDMKVLECMVRLKIFEFPTMNTADIRKKAITQLKKEFPVIFKEYSKY